MCVTARQAAANVCAHHCLSTGTLVSMQVIRIANSNSPNWTNNMPKRVTLPFRRHRIRVKNRAHLKPSRINHCPRATITMMVSALMFSFHYWIFKVVRNRSKIWQQRHTTMRVAQRWRWRKRTTQKSGIRKRLQFMTPGLEGPPPVALTNWWKLWMPSAAPRKCASSHRIQCTIMNIHMITIRPNRPHTMTTMMMRLLTKMITLLHRTRTPAASGNRPNGIPVRWPHHRPDGTNAGIFQTKVPNCKCPRRQHQRKNCTRTTFNRRHRIRKANGCRARKSLNWIINKKNDRNFGATHAIESFPQAKVLRFSLRFISFGLCFIARGTYTDSIKFWIFIRAQFTNDICDRNCTQNDLNRKPIWRQSHFLCHVSMMLLTRRPPHRLHDGSESRNSRRLHPRPALKRNYRDENVIDAATTFDAIYANRDCDAIYLENIWFRTITTAAWWWRSSQRNPTIQSWKISIKLYYSRRFNVNRVVSMRTPNSSFCDTGTRPSTSINAVRPAFSGAHSVNSIAKETMKCSSIFLAPSIKRSWWPSIDRCR